MLLAQNWRAGNHIDLDHGSHSLTYSQWPWATQQELLDVACLQNTEEGSQRGLNCLVIMQKPVKPTVIDCLPLFSLKLCFYTERRYYVRNLGWMVCCRLLAASDLKFSCTSPEWLDSAGLCFFLTIKLMIILILIFICKFPVFCWMCHLVYCTIVLELSLKRESHSLRRPK